MELCRSRKWSDLKQSASCLSPCMAAVITSNREQIALQIWRGLEAAITRIKIAIHLACKICNRNSLPPTNCQRLKICSAPNIIAIRLGGPDGSRCKPRIFLHSFNEFSTNRGLARDFLCHQYLFNPTIRRINLQVFATGVKRCNKKQENLRLGLIYL